MGYTAGVDLGTTFTAAAVVRDGHAEMVNLGSGSHAVPSVVFLSADQTFVVGEAASQRSAAEPERVAREFKRRVGDPVPIMLGGSPIPAHILMSEMLSWSVEHLSEREGEQPESVAVTHPANWGDYKRDYLRQAVDHAGLAGVDVRTVTEPEAAAVHYAARDRIDPGSAVAVYDLGGGTFDATVLRRTAVGFEMLGQPAGVENLGGMDFDEAILGHVDRQLDGALSRVDGSEAAAAMALHRLREECVRAKIALSADTSVSIPVLLPNLQTEVRLTRNEFETLIKLSLDPTVAALHRVVSSAGLAPDDVDRVLLVGGSSRIPLVGQLVSQEMGRPVAVDTDPKNVVAQGAARWAAGGLPAAVPAEPAAPEQQTPLTAEPAPAGTAPPAPIHDGDRAASAPPVTPVQAVSDPAPPPEVSPAEAAPWGAGAAPPSPGEATMLPPIDGAASGRDEGSEASLTIATWLVGTSWLAVVVWLVTAITTMVLLAGNNEEGLDPFSIGGRDLDEVTELGAVVVVIAAVVLFVALLGRRRRKRLPTYLAVAGAIALVGCAFAFYTCGLGTFEASGAVEAAQTSELEGGHTLEHSVPWEPCWPMFLAAPVALAAIIIGLVMRGSSATAD